MSKYDKTKSLTENAIAGVDITEPNLPTEIDLTKEKEFCIPDELWDAINEFLADEHGLCVNSYGLELKVVDIDWDTSDIEQKEYERNLAYDIMRHGE